MLKEEAPSRTHHNLDILKPEVAKGKLTADQIFEADSILRDRDLQLEGKRYIWDQLATEVEAEISHRTIRRTMHMTLDYEKHLACTIGYLSENAMKRRVEYSHIMLRKYPDPEDWDHYDSVMKYTLAMDLNANYTSLDQCYFTSERDISTFNRRK